MYSWRLKFFFVNKMLKDYLKYYLFSGTLLKKTITYKILFTLLIVIVSGCSTKKNTWTSRTAQSINTKFNVHFNGAVSYNEGLKNIINSNKEDYSTLIPMYPISQHANASAATSNMDRTIEKCRKAIKLHSIKVKPKKNTKKEKLPEYMNFYNQKEFNPELKNAWLMLAQAEFHKGDFLGASATFSYISRHYITDNDMIALCQLWKVRAYGEIGWIYEAEEVLSKIVQDNLRLSSIGLFAAVNADLLLKKQQYKEAIPFLELALSKEKDKDLKQRFGYLLAQLYIKTGNDAAAFESFSRVIKTNPPYEMDFNARINRAQIDKGNVLGVRKDLRNMLKNSNNNDYLDQIYFAIGNTYLNHNDTLKAIENYKLSVEKSKRNGIDKSVTLITLGDIFYNKRNYLLAQPCYDEAAKIITNEHKDYERVKKRAETLSELVTQNDIVVLQDSLQRLAAMTESQRLEVIKELIEKLISDEKVATEKQLKNADSPDENMNGNRNRFTEQEEDLGRLPQIGSSSGNSGEWYFYNSELIRTGQSEFLKKWGKRKLEDNWRRTNKTATIFADENIANAATIVKDTTDTVSKKNDFSDTKNPEFYLKLVPVTPAQITKSNAEIATALLSMGLIYKDKIEDIPMAISTLELLISRFGTDKIISDAYFQLYMIAIKMENKKDAEKYRLRLISEFPSSKYAEILSQTNYKERLSIMYGEQDSIYNLTYKAYNESDYQTVFKHLAYIQQNYPISTLMPKFLFLNALSIGKKDTPEKFQAALNELVTKYPESDVSAMSKDILALIKQGHEAKTGTSSGTLLTRRDEAAKNKVDEQAAPLQFSPEKHSKHRLLFICSITTDSMNMMLYNIASFNFSRFMIKNFDLVINKLDSSKNILCVTNFESFDEAQWYVNSIGTDALITKLLADFQVQKVIISEENYVLLRTKNNLSEYLGFQEKNIVTKQSNQSPANKQLKKPESIATVKNVATKNISIVLQKKIEVKPEKTVAKTDEKVTENTIEKSLEKVVEKPIDMPVEITIGKAFEKPTTKQPEKSVEKQIVKPLDKVIPSINDATKKETVVNTLPTTTIEPKLEDVPLYKNLFAYRTNEPHFVAIYILSGNFDFEKTKAALNDYNAKNYSIMNLKVSVETVAKQQIIIIGSMSDANVAKSYLLRMVKENGIFEGLKNADYRNLLGSQKNLNILMQQNALNVYFEFMTEYYLK